MLSRRLYAPPPSFAMEAAYLKNLRARTGKNLDEWIALVATGPATSRERREWLKSEHGISTNYAAWIVERAEGGKGVEDYDADAMVGALFAGPKAALLPVYDRVLEAAAALGDDVRACPRKTIVPLYRNHVFAQVRPAARDRIELGLALGSLRGNVRLVQTGGLAKGDRITHSIALRRVSEVDFEVERWLRTAYELDK